MNQFWGAMVAFGVAYCVISLLDEIQEEMKWRKMKRQGYGLWWLVLA